MPPAARSSSVGLRPQSSRALRQSSDDLRGKPMRVRQDENLKPAQPVGAAPEQGSMVWPSPA